MYIESIYGRNLQTLCKFKPSSRALKDSVRCIRVDWEDHQYRQIYCTRSSQIRQRLTYVLVMDRQFGFNLFISYKVKFCTFRSEWGRRRTFGIAATLRSRRPTVHASIPGRGNRIFPCQNLPEFSESQPLSSWVSNMGFVDGVIPHLSPSSAEFKKT